MNITHSPYPPPMIISEHKPVNIPLSTSLVDSGHDRRMISVEHSGDIMQGITLLISVPDNRFLFWRVVNARSLFHSKVPLD